MLHSPFPFQAWLGVGLLHVLFQSFIAFHGCDSLFITQFAVTTIGPGKHMKLSTQINMRWIEDWLIEQASV